MSDNNIMFEFSRVYFSLKMTEVQSKLMEDFIKIAPTIENRVELLRAINYILPVSTNEKT